MIPTILEANFGTFLGPVSSPSPASVQSRMALPTWANASCWYSQQSYPERYTWWFPKIGLPPVIINFFDFPWKKIHFMGYSHFRKPHIWNVWMHPNWCLGAITMHQTWLIKLPLPQLPHHIYWSLQWSKHWRPLPPLQRWAARAARCRRERKSMAQRETWDSRSHPLRPEDREI